MKNSFPAELTRWTREGLKSMWRALQGFITLLLRLSYLHVKR